VLLRIEVIRRELGEVWDERGMGPLFTTSQLGSSQIAAALSSCPSPRDRARLGLDMLLERSGAVAGFLYAIEAAGPVLAAQSSPLDPPTGLAVAVAAHLRMEAADVDTTGIGVASSASEACTVAESGAAFLGLGRPGSELRSCVIGHATSRGFEVTGLAILEIQAGKSYSVPADVASQLSRSWFDSGDVTSITAWIAGRTVS